MKFKWLLTSLILFVFLLSGCVRADMHATLNKDGSADMDFKIAMDKKILEKNYSPNQNPLQQLDVESRSEGYSTSFYDDGNYKGIELKKHVPDAKSLSSNSSLLGNGNFKTNFSLTEDKGFFSDTYHLKLILSPEKSPHIGNSITDYFIKSMFNIKFAITLPLKVDNSNANYVLDGGKTYQWDIDVTKNNVLTLDYSVPSFSKIALFSAILLVIAFSFLFLVFKKKKSHP